MTFPYFTLTSIILGVIGAVFGTFPYVYTQTVGRLSGRLRKTERIFSTLLDKGELTDLQSIHELLGGIDIKEHQGIVKLQRQTGVMFGKATITDWIVLYDANGKTTEHLDTKAVLDLLRTSSDRYRNRVAFGFIAVGYSAQIFGLALGIM